MGLLLGEAFPAEDRAALSGAEGDSGFLATLGTRSSCFHASVMVGFARARVGKNGNAFGLTGFTALGLVLKLFVVEKQLFPGSKNEFSAAIDAGQYLILKFH